MDKPMQNIPKIAITGTKGKTTVTYVVADVLRRLKYDVLKVDTTGHFVNGEQRSTLEDSRNLWNLVPSVCPGRYLYEFHTDKALLLSKKPVAVMECSLGCSASAGLGYRQHEIGVFLNVMEDHIGSSDRLKTSADVAEAKNFIFRRIKQNGYVVFNADDPYVAGQLSAVPQIRDAVLVPCGLDFSQFDVEAHLKAGGTALSVKQHKVILLTQKGETTLFDLKAIPWTFEAAYKPSVYNLLHATGALYGFFGGKLPEHFGKLIEATRLDPEGGRLTLFKAQNGAIILADYAHEKNSLREVARLGRSMIKRDGKLTGVIRLAYDRSPKLIRETGHFIANDFDNFYVYDKVDGYWLKGDNLKGRRFQKVEGHVSQLLYDALVDKNPNVTRILREDEAIEEAASRAQPNDVIIVIVNDDIKRSLNFVKTSFNAREL
jgi:cyanophycin synthetase